MALRIFIGIVIGVVLAGVCSNISSAVSEENAKNIIDSIGIVSIFGTCFIVALKAVAPVLVFFQVQDSIIGGTTGFDSRFSKIVILYFTSTILAALLAIGVSIINPVDMHLSTEFVTTGTANITIGGILKNTLEGIFVNPFEALMTGKFLCIIFWSILISMTMKSFVRESTKENIHDFTNAVARIVKMIINLAPLGIMGLVFLMLSPPAVLLSLPHTAVCLSHLFPPCW